MPPPKLPLTVQLLTVSDDVAPAWGSAVDDAAAEVAAHYAFAQRQRAAIVINAAAYHL